MIRIEIKPLSINEAFAGRRFKTPKHNKYINDVLYLLPKIKLNKAPYHLIIEFGVSSKGADLDNCFKPFIDCLVKKYAFDDREIYRIEATKTIVKKGKEFIYFEIKSLVSK